MENKESKEIKEKEIKETKEKVPKKEIKEKADDTSSIEKPVKKHSKKGHTHKIEPPKKKDPESDEELREWIEHLVNRYCLGKAEYVRKAKIVDDLYDILFENMSAMKSDFESMDKNMENFMKYIGDYEDDGTGQLTEVLDMVVSVVSIIADKFIEKELVEISDNYIASIQRKLENLVQNYVQSKELKFE